MVKLANEGKGIETLFKCADYAVCAELMKFTVGAVKAGSAAPRPLRRAHLYRLLYTNLEEVIYATTNLGNHTRENRW